MSVIGNYLQAVEGLADEHAADRRDAKMLRERLAAVAAIKQHGCHDWQDYGHGWDDCLELVRKTLGLEGQADYP